MDVTRVKRNTHDILVIVTPQRTEQKTHSPHRSHETRRERLRIVSWLLLASSDSVCPMPVWFSLVNCLRMSVFTEISCVAEIIKVPLHHGEERCSGNREPGIFSFTE